MAHLRDGMLTRPATVWICELLRREERKGVLKRWFWMVVLATAELYGGEWSSFCWFYSLLNASHVGPRRVRRGCG